MSLYQDCIYSMPQWNWFQWKMCGGLVVFVFVWVFDWVSCLNMDVTREFMDVPFWRAASTKSFNFKNEG